MDFAGNGRAGTQFEARQALGLRNEGAQHVGCATRGRERR